MVAWKIALDRIVPVINIGMPVNDITMEHLRNIYNGRITKWSDIGGPGAPIEEQSATSGEVSESMENVIGISKDSQSAVSQINTTAGDLAKVANELMELVSWFKVDSNAVHKEKDMESLAAFENEDTAAIPDGNGDKSKSQVCA